MPREHQSNECLKSPGSRGLIGRRRTLSLLAAVAGAGLPGLAGAGGSAAATRDLPIWRWQGVALGAQAELVVAHPDLATAKRLVGLALAEVERLETIFSLYRPDSAVTRLNAELEIGGPPLELVDLLTRAQAWSRATGGAFDVTVQPLWALYRDHFARVGADPEGPSPQAVAEAVRKVGYRGLEVSPARVRLARPGMAVTLNGIAQGYITDRVADLLRAEGLDRVLVCLGEVRGLGQPADGRPWRLGLDGPADRPSQTIEIVDQAVATSSPTGLRFDSQGRFHHLLDPLTGRCATGYRSASVVAQRACDADALATALSVAGRPCASAEDLRGFGVARMIVSDDDGRVRSLT
jgi:thiamine biosynthesis lipoprotein